MKDSDIKVLTPYAIISVLLLVIISLILSLNNRSYYLLPQWLLETLSLGLFTLTGAGLGAYLAGIYTLKSVKEQIEHSKEDNKIARKNANDSALKIIEYVLENLFGVFIFVTSSIKNGAGKPDILTTAANEFNESIMDIEDTILNIQLLSKIHLEYIEEIPGEVRKNLSHLKDIIRVLNLHATTLTEDDLINISNELFDIFDNLSEISKKIKSITR